MRPRHAATATLLAVVLLAAAASAQVYPHLGLSASPDEYVGVIEVPYGESFTLYVVMTGPDLAPLPFELDTVQWALLGSCCGGSPAIYLDTILNDQMTHVGDPNLAVTSEATTCLDGDFIVLAEVSFNWLYEPSGPFHLGAAALSAAIDCEGEPWIPIGLSLEIIPLGITPAETSSWGGVKSLYR